MLTNGAVRLVVATMALEERAQRERRDADGPGHRAVLRLYASQVVQSRVDGSPRLLLQLRIHRVSRVGERRRAEREHGSQQGESLHRVCSISRGRSPACVSCRYCLSRVNRHRVPGMGFRDPGQKSGHPRMTGGRFGFVAAHAGTGRALGPGFLAVAKSGGAAIEAASAAGCPFTWNKAIAVPASRLLASELVCYINQCIGCRCRGRDDTFRAPPPPPVVVVEHASGPQEPESTNKFKLYGFRQPGGWERYRRGRKGYGL